MIFESNIFLDKSREYLDINRINDHIFKPEAINKNKQ
jgi:hypothetical protein